MRRTMLTVLLAAATLAMSAPLHAQDAQQGDTTHHKPLTPKTVAKATAKETERAAKHTSAETKRVAKRTAKTAKKAEKDTEAQAHRTRRQAKRAIRHATSDTTAH